MKPAPTMSKSNAARYGCAAVLAAVGAFLVYEMVATDSSSGAAKMIQECGLPADRYQLVQVYKGNGQLELSMYTFEQDGISMAVLDHTAGMVSSSHIQEKACKRPTSTACSCAGSLDRELNLKFSNAGRHAREGLAQVL
jgi:hypothetical protein